MLNGSGLQGRDYGWVGSYGTGSIITSFSFLLKTPPTTERFGQAATMEGIGAIGGTPPAFNRAAPGAEFAPNKRCRY